MSEKQNKKRGENPPLTMESRLQLLYHNTLSEVETLIREGQASSQILTQIIKDNSDIAIIQAEIKLEKTKLEAMMLKEKIESERAARNQSGDIQEVKAALLRYQGPDHARELEELRKTNRTNNV